MRNLADLHVDPSDSSSMVREDGVPLGNGIVAAPVSAVCLSVIIIFIYVWQSSIDRDRRELEEEWHKVGGVHPFEYKTNGQLRKVTHPCDLIVTVCLLQPIKDMGLACVPIVAGCFEDHLVHGWPTCPACNMYAPILYMHDLTRLCRPQVFVAAARGHVSGYPKFDLYRKCPMQAKKAHCTHLSHTDDLLLTSHCTFQGKTTFYRCSPPGTPTFPKLQFGHTIFYAGSYYLSEENLTLPYRPHFDVNGRILKKSWPPNSSLAPCKCNQPPWIRVR